MSRTVETEQWSIVVPDTCSGGGAVKPPEEFTSMALLWGDIAPGVHAVVTVSTSNRRGITLRRRARELARIFVQPMADGEQIDVPGARGARRMDGSVAMEDDRAEPVTMVVAAARREFVIVTVRVQSRGPAREAVDAVIGSLVIRE